ncbi:type I-E CRISPR-associated protein Cse2/CasB [Rhodocaloribacter sp.]
MNTETATQTPEKSSQAAFVSHLYGLAKRAEGGDGTARAKLARLRRTLTGRTLTYNGLSEVGDRLPPDLPDPALDTYLLVAALFALNGSATRPPNESFGGTLKRLRKDLSAGAESLDRRVGALLDADAEELPYRLRQLSQQLASRNLAPDYYRLLEDLLKWDLPSRSIQRKWARDYWT